MSPIAYSMQCTPIDSDDTSDNILSYNDEAVENSADAAERNPFSDTVDELQYNNIADPEAQGLLLSDENISELTTSIIEDIVEEVPVADLMGGFGFEAASIIEAMHRDTSDWYRQTEQIADITLETIGNFFPPAILVTSVLEILVNELLEKAREEHIASVYAEYYADHHATAVSLEEIVESHQENFKIFLLNALKRNIDELLLESNSIYGSSILAYEDLYRSIQSNFNQRQANALNAHLTPVGDTSSYTPPSGNSAAKPVFDNHYDVLNNVCKDSYDQLLNILASEQSTSEADIQAPVVQHVNCVNEQLIKRAQILIDVVFDPSSEVMSSLDDHIQSIPHDIYANFAEITGDAPQHRAIFSQFLVSEAERVKSEVINSTYVAAVVNNLQQSYEAITFSDARLLALSNSHQGGGEWVGYRDNGVEQTRQCLVNRCNRTDEAGHLDQLLPVIPGSPPTCPASNDERIEIVLWCESWSPWTNLMATSFDVSLEQAAVSNFEFDNYINDNAETNVFDKTLSDFKTFDVINEAAQYYQKFAAEYLTGEFTFSFAPGDRGKIDQALLDQSTEIPFDNPPYVPLYVEDISVLIAGGPAVVEELSSIDNLGLERRRLRVEDAHDISPGSVLSLYNLMQSSAEVSGSSVCAKLDYSPYSSHSVDLPDSDCAGNIGECTHVQIVNVTNRSYSYHPENNICTHTSDKEVTYQFNGAFNSGSRHTVLHSERDNIYMPLSYFTYLQDTQVQDMQSMVPYLGVHEFLHYYNPNIWSANTADAIHQGMMTFIRDNKNLLLGGKDQDFYKKVIFALLRNFYDPYRADNFVNHEKHDYNIIKTNVYNPDHLYTAPNFGSSSLFSNSGFSHSLGGIDGQSYKFPFYVIDETGKYHLVSGTQSTLLTFGILRQDFSRILNLTDASTAMEYTYPLVFNDAQEEARALGLYGTYIELIQTYLTHYLQTNQEHERVTITSAFPRIGVVSNGDQLVLRDIDDYLSDIHTESSLAGKTLKIHAQKMPDADSVIAQNHSIVGLYDLNNILNNFSSSSSNGNAVEIIELIYAIRYGAEAMVAELYPSSGDVGSIDPTTFMDYLTNTPIVEYYPFSAASSAVNTEFLEVTINNLIGGRGEMLAVLKRLRIICLSYC